MKKESIEVFNIACVIATLVCTLVTLVTGLRLANETSQEVISSMSYFGVPITAYTGILAISFLAMSYGWLMHFSGRELLRNAISARRFEHIHTALRNKSRGTAIALFSWSCVYAITYSVFSYYKCSSSTMLAAISAVTILALTRHFLEFFHSTMNRNEEILESLKKE